MYYLFGIFSFILRFFQLNISSSTLFCRSLFELILWLKWSQIPKSSIFKILKIFDCGMSFPNVEFLKRLAHKFSFPIFSISLRLWRLNGVEKSCKLSNVRGQECNPPSNPIKITFRTITHRTHVADRFCEKCSFSKTA